MSVQTAYLLSLAICNAMAEFDVLCVCVSCHVVGMQKIDLAFAVQKTAPLSAAIHQHEAHGSLGQWWSRRRSAYSNQSLGSYVKGDVTRKPAHVSLYGNLLLCDGSFDAWQKREGQAGHPQDALGTLHRTSGLQCSTPNMTGRRGPPYNASDPRSPLVV